MDCDISISQIAEREQPMLMKVEFLVSRLRACSQIAASSLAARIEIYSESGSPYLFATEITSITNGGLDALADVVTFLNDMRRTADSMARPDGTLQGLERSYGKPRQRETHKRLQERLRKQVTCCKTMGKELATKLREWKLDIEKFQRTVASSKTSIDTQLQKCDRERGRLEDAIKDTEDKVKDSEEEEKKPRETNEWGFGGWTQYLQNYITTADAKQAKESNTLAKQKAADYDQDLMTAEGYLRKQNERSFELTEFTKGLELTLRALSSFADSVTVLLTNFSEMDSDLKQILGYHEETDEMSLAAAGDEAVPVSEVQGFSDNIHAMSQRAIVVEMTSWLYADIIQKVMIGGFEDITKNVRTGHIGNTDERSLQLWPSSSESSSCMSISTKVEQIGKNKLNDLGRRREKSVKDLRALTKAEAKAAKKKTGRFFRH